MWAKGQRSRASGHLPCSLALVVRRASQPQGRELSEGGAAEGTGGERKGLIQAEREDDLPRKASETQARSSLTAQTLFIV